MFGFFIFLLSSLPSFIIMNHRLLIQLLNQHLKNTANLSVIPPNIWLIGTSHCHLCELAQAQLQLCQKVIVFTYQQIDIVDLLSVDLPSQLANPNNASGNHLNNDPDDSLDNGLNNKHKHNQHVQPEQLAQSIPILVSESGMLCHPFGILDIQRLLLNQTIKINGC